MTSCHTVTCLALSTVLLTAPAAAQQRGARIAGAPAAVWTSAARADGAAVADAPFSADATTTVMQTLGDGTRIEQQTQTKLYRDRAGRMRREQTILGLDSLNGNQTQTLISIDGIEGDTWLLDPMARTAFRAPGHVMLFHPQGAAPVAARVEAFGVGMPAGVRRWSTPAPNGANVAVDEVTTSFNIVADAGPAAVAHAGLPADVKPTEEQLGTREMEGVKVTGRRTTTIIPLGRIGNDQPIRITDERWESPELQTLVYSRFADPRTGVVEYKLTNIRRAEPPPSLFEVPADYTVMGNEPGTRGRRGN